MFEVFGFYKFISLNNLKKSKNLLNSFLIKKNIHGTLIISKEGINGTISGKFKDCKDLINFIDVTCKNKDSFNKRKAQKALSSTSFTELKKLERIKGFSESIMSTNMKKKIPFFYLGPQNDWKKNLSKDFQNKLNSVFKNNLVELDY